MSSIDINLYRVVFFIKELCVVLGLEERTHHGYSEILKAVKELKNQAIKVNVLNDVLDDYQARFTVLHDAWDTGDNAAILETLRKHLRADDENGKNIVKQERDQAIAKLEEIKKITNSI